MSVIEPKRSNGWHTEWRHSPYLSAVWLIVCFDRWSWNVWLLNTRIKSEISVLPSWVIRRLPKYLCLNAAYNAAIHDLALSGVNDQAVRLYVTTCQHEFWSVVVKRRCRRHLQWKKNKYYILWVCVCSFTYPVCSSHAPFCHLWPAPLYSIFSTLSHKRHDLKKNDWTQNMCFDVLYSFCLKHFSFQSEFSEILSQMYEGE